MRNISFMLTTEQIRNRTKTVTRRNGWANAKPGDVYQGVVKGQGLKKGEHPEKLEVIKVAAVRQEPLNRMTKEPAYGAREVILEGFPQMTPRQFVQMYCQHNQCTPRKRVTRIEFTYEN